MSEGRASVSALIESHQRRLNGFMRVRVRDDSTAEDLVQDTWAEVLRRIDTFDSGRGSFWTFTKIWAAIVLKRHWDEKTPETVELDDDRDVERAADGSGGGQDIAASADLAAGLPDGLAVEDRVHAARTLLDLLCHVMACSRPPHEVIVFGFSKLLWKPSEIVEELSDRPLRGLAARLEADYRAAVPIPAVRAAFSPLLEKLDRPLGDLIEDPRTRRGNESLLARVAGDTTLADYYPDAGNAEAAVTRWWDAVKRAVFSEIRREGDGAVFAWLYGPDAAGSARQEVGGS